MKPDDAKAANREQQEAELTALGCQMNEEDFDAFESGLRLKAAVLGWTGDPLKQPIESVLAVSRSIVAKKQMRVHP